MLPIKEVLKIAENQLADAGVRDAKIDAKEIFCYVFNYSKTDLMMRWQDSLQDNQIECYFSVIEERAKRIPLQHITGEQEFMGHKFLVSDKVLIPRQDTETVVEDAISILESGTVRGIEIRNPKADAKILDLCTGSGAIGITLAKHFPKASVMMTDISLDAVKTARKNAELNVAKVHIDYSDMFKDFKKGVGRKRFDMIISNPPYIRRSDIEGLDIEVKDHEPIMALDGGEDGLDFYREIAKSAYEHMAQNGILVLEIGYDQASDVKSILEESGYYTEINSFKDLAGNDRVVVAKYVKEKNG